MTIFNACNNKSPVVAAGHFTSTTATVNLAANAITQIPLTDMDGTGNVADYFQISSGAVKLKKRGVYLISGSTYINLGTSTAMTGTYITLGSGAELQSQYLYNGGAGVKSSGVVIINLAAGNTVKLNGRANAATTVIGSNIGTHLDIVYLGAY